MAGEKNTLKAWVATVDMGLGHQRAIYPLTHLAEGGFITVGSDSASDEDYSPGKIDYFNTFSRVIRETDILWTKPSELSFYCGLGIPIIMSPDVGSQEIYNRKWLIEVQAGISQEDPDYTDQWLFDLINAGRLAESAWDGCLKARKFGTYKIAEILKTGTMARETSPLKR